MALVLLCSLRAEGTFGTLGCCNMVQQGKGRLVRLSSADLFILKTFGRVSSNVTLYTARLFEQQSELSSQNSYCTDIVGLRGMHCQNYEHVH